MTKESKRLCGFCDCKPVYRNDVLCKKCRRDTNEQIYEGEYHDFDAYEAFGLKPIFSVDVKILMHMHRMFKYNEDNEGRTTFMVIKEIAFC